MRDDTIVAIATPPGQGGIGIVRLSGRDAEVIGTRLFSRKLRDRRAIVGRVEEPGTGEVVDEAIALLMRAPKTYTREDTLEIQSHGGPVCLQRILELALIEGARLAEPGEFTLRAFLNGRLDLAQAESVLDLIQARTDAARRFAVQGLGGRLSAEIRTIRSSLLDALAYLSARADFPDEDVPRSNISPALGAAEDCLERLIRTASAGMLYRQGAQVAIAGSPNVGKSSLMNRLVREDRAIVTAYAGTTRDTVSETINLSGLPVVLTDTAGLETTQDPIELLGIERTREAIKKSDLVLLVLECGRPLRQQEQRLLDETEGRPRVIAINKCDLGKPPDLEQTGALEVSALTGAGIAELEQRVADVLLQGEAARDDSAIVTNPRHLAALRKAEMHVREAHLALAAGIPEDMASGDLRLAVEALGEITGESVTQDLLDSIFRNFCIGK